MQAAMKQKGLDYELSGITTQLVGKPGNASQAPSDGASSNNQALIIGLVVPGAFVLCAACAYVIRRYKVRVHWATTICSSAYHNVN